MKAPSNQRNFVSRKIMKDGTHDAYTAFKNDRERLWALMSRDLRLVLCTLAIVIGAPQIAPALLRWLWRIA